MKHVPLFLILALLFIVAHEIVSTNPKGCDVQSFDRFNYCMGVGELR